MPTRTSGGGGGDVDLLLRRWRIDLLLIAIARPRTNYYYYHRHHRHYLSFRAIHHLEDDDYLQEKSHGPWTGGRKPDAKKVALLDEMNIGGAASPGG